MAVSANAKNRKDRIVAGQNDDDSNDSAIPPDTCSRMNTDGRWQDCKPRNTPNTRNEDGVEFNHKEHRDHKKGIGILCVLCALCG